MAKLIGLFFAKFCCVCAEEQTNRIIVSSVSHAEELLSLSLKEAVVFSASLLTAISNVTDILLATSSSVSCLQFYLFSTEVHDWILMFGREYSVLVKLCCKKPVFYMTLLPSL
jgi:hypothetical protein